MVSFLLLVLLALSGSSSRQAPSEDDQLRLEAVLVGHCEQWLKGAFQAPSEELRFTRSRRVASGSVEELVLDQRGPLALPTAFVEVFAQGDQLVKLLDHGPQEARFRVRMVGADARDSALLDAVGRHVGPNFELASWTLRWARPLGGRFVDVTADLLRDDRGSAATLALGVDELRERLDPRLGVALVGHVAGLAAGDLDGDGRTDLVLAAPGGVRNRVLVAEPDGRAVDRSTELGLDVLDATRGILAADLTGSGDVDVLYALGDELVGFERDVDGRFEVAQRFPADATTSLAAADVDLDGFLDVYVCGYANPYEGGAVPLPYHDADNGVANVLWRGRGGWNFEQATARLGLDENNRRFSFAASFADLDADGDPDLYVANDFGRNNLYENRGAEGFVDVAGTRGVEDLAAGMGVTFGDVDLDGDDDVYVANMFSSAGHRVAYAPSFREGVDDDERAAYRRHARGNSLFVNEGERFVEQGGALGVDVGWWAWGVRFCDVDADGALDLAVPAGMVTREDPGDL